MPAKTIHTQQNLPDPNLHLVLEKNQLTLIGPVSKKYSYKMSGTGGIVGVKFALAALAPHLPHTMSYYVDKTLPASHLFTEDIAHHLVSLLQSSDDQQAVSCLEAYLKNLAVEHSDAQKQAATLVNLIKHSLISTVSHNWLTNLVYHNEAYSGFVIAISAFPLSG